MSRPKIGAARANAGALALPQDGQIAQGRNYDHVRLQDLPEPLDVGDKTGDLDADETKLLGMCERAVFAWDEAATVGMKALVNIRDRRLYRASHGTFEAYCQDRFGRTRLWANRQIEHHEVTQILGSRGNQESPPELTGRAARELAKANREAGPAEVQAVYDETAATGPVTGERLKVTRERRAAPEPGPEDEVHEAEVVEDEAAEAPRYRELFSELRRIIESLDDRDALQEIMMGGLSIGSTARTRLDNL